MPKLKHYYTPVTEQDYDTWNTTGWLHPTQRTWHSGNFMTGRACTGRVWADSPEGADHIGQLVWHWPGVTRVMRVRGLDLRGHALLPWSDWSGQEPLGTVWCSVGSVRVRDTRVYFFETSQTTQVTTMATIVTDQPQVGQTIIPIVIPVE